jgi:hypothetical protein
MNQWPREVNNALFLDLKNSNKLVRKVCTPALDYPPHLYEILGILWVEFLWNNGCHSGLKSSATRSQIAREYRWTRVS